MAMEMLNEDLIPGSTIGSVLSAIEENNLHVIRSGLLIYYGHGRAAKWPSSLVQEVCSTLSRSSLFAQLCSALPSWNVEHNSMKALILATAGMPIFDDIFDGQFRKFAPLRDLIGAAFHGRHLTRKDEHHEGLEKLLSNYGEEFLIEFTEDEVKTILDSFMKTEFAARDLSYPFGDFVGSNEYSKEYLAKLHYWSGPYVHCIEDCESKVMFYPFVCPVPEPAFLSGADFRSMKSDYKVAAVIRDRFFKAWPLEHRISMVQYLYDNEEAEILATAMRACERITDHHEYITTLLFSIPREIANSLLENSNYFYRLSVIHFRLLGR